MREIYFYSEKKIGKIIKEMFVSFDVQAVSAEELKKNNFINQNIILFLEEGLLNILKSTFFINNNIVIFFETNKNFNNKNFVNAKVFNNHINVNKFIDEVTTSFVESALNFEDIKIFGEKVINNQTKKETYLTSLEKNILRLLIDQRKTEKNSLLEDVLKIKKDTETKTIQSHLTRIRNKLAKINSKLKIVSKGKEIFLEY